MIKEKDIRRELLGSILKWPSGCNEVTPLLGWEDCLSSDLSKVLPVICKIYESGKPVGISSVLRMMQEDDPKLDYSYYNNMLNDCLDVKVSTIHIKNYVDEIVGQLTTGKIRDMIMEVGSSHLNEHASPEVLVDSIQACLDEINGSLSCTEEITLDGSCDEQFSEFQKYLVDGESPVMTTGYCSLDRLIKGYKGGQYILVSAMSSIGKSAFATGAMIQQRLRGVRGGFISLEMDAPCLTNRLVQQVSGFDVDNFYDRRSFTNFDTGKVSRCPNEAEAYYKDALARLKKMQLRTAHPRNPTLASIKSICRQMAKDDIDIIYIDYLQLIVGDRRLTREREISAISDALRRLAIELKLPICVLAQQNTRALEAGPQSQFVRECAQVKNDAFICILINNDSKGNRINEIIVDKNRQGRKGKIPIDFNGDYVSFVDRADTGAEEPF